MFMSDMVDADIGSRFMEDVAKEVVPELKACLVNVEGMRVLRHPLVYEILPIDGLANRQLRHKRGCVSTRPDCACGAG